MRHHELIAFGDVDPASRQQSSAVSTRRASRAAACCAPIITRAIRCRSAASSPPTDVVMPAGVGYDIGCGNCAVQTRSQGRRRRRQARDGRSVANDLVRDGPQQRRAHRAIIRCSMRSARVRSSSSANYSRSRADSSARSAAAITTSICSRIARTARCGSACISDRAALGTRRRRVSCRWRRARAGTSGRRQHGRAARR